ncbi:hypothetical protein ACBR40_05955 [Nonomuraea sp. AD125B]|uniref:hypothetical protein n=1 Tax=Nonomuraea sp. AD125B TaxID=3242897 RepID=UPI0035276FC2
MVRRRELLAGAVAAALAGAGQPPAAAAVRRSGRDFPKVGGNLANHNHSALRRLHPGNVRRLRGARSPGAGWRSARARSSPAPTTTG